MATITRNPGESDGDYIKRLEAAASRAPAPKPAMAKLKLTSGTFTHPVTGAVAPKRWNLSMGTVSVHVTDDATIPTNAQLQNAKADLKAQIERLYKGEFPTDAVLLAEAKALVK